MSGILFALPAFAGGALISLANHFITKSAMKDGGTRFAMAGPLRTVLCAAYLVILYLIGSRTSAPLTALLVGGALGLTAGLAVSTYILMKAQNKK